MEYSNSITNLYGKLPVSQDVYELATAYEKQLKDTGIDEKSVQSSVIKVAKQLQKKKDDAEKEEATQLRKEKFHLEGLLTDDEGRPLNILENYISVLKNPDYNPHRISYNEFTQEICFDDRQYNEPMDLPILRRLISIPELSFSSKDKTQDAISIISQENKFHPVKDYLNSIKWDGNHRAVTMLIDYLGADDNEITKTMTAIWLYATVKRIFQPGCKFDQILIMHGAQGAGKSILCQRLAKGKWYIENINIGNKDAYMDVKYSWIIIMDELGSMQWRETNDVKNFLSRTQDTFRAPYGKCNITYPRHCTFIGSTNDDQFLKDPSSIDERRYWIVHCNRTAANNIVWDKFTSDIVDQIWAEVMSWYKSDPNWELVLPKELWDQYYQMQRQYKTDSNNPLFDLLDCALECKYPYNLKSGLYYARPNLNMSNYYNNLGTDTNVHKLDVIPITVIQQFLYAEHRESKSAAHTCKKFAMWKSSMWNVAKKRIPDAPNPISCLVRIGKITEEADDTKVESKGLFDV